MSHILIVLLVVTMGLTAAVLATGLVSMARGGPFHKKYANRLMWLRVVFQGLAVLLVLLIVFLFKGR